MEGFITTDEFGSWLQTLNTNNKETVLYLVKVLKAKGLALGYPYSSAIEGSKFPFRELRSHKYGTELRIIYAYDRQRNAVLIIGGDKTGNPRFYAEIVPKAEAIWKAYLRERAEELEVKGHRKPK